VTDNKMNFEAKIRETVHRAAKARAAENAQELSRVAQAILIRASKAASPEEGGVAHPAKRPTGAPVKRIRFRIDSEAHEVIKARIRGSGTSMTAALEEGLENYARTGQY
jgi:predicted HicB family RNase H-like nuclease